MTTETKGYTFNGITGRIRDLENKTNGGYYVALIWLAMARNSGKGARKLLETKIFADGKPTSTFRNAWRIADKSFAEGFHAGHRTAVAEMLLDEAIEFAVKALDDHKAALDVSNMKDYEELCKYASAADIPPAAEDEPEGETEEPEGKSDEPDTDADGKPEPEGVDIMANLRNAVAQLTFDQMLEHAAWLADMIEAARASAEGKAEGEAEGEFDPAAELEKAKAEGNAKRAKKAA